MRAMGFNFSALTVTIFNSQDTNTAERSMCHTPVIRLCREIIVEENVCMWVCLLDGWWSRVGQSSRSRSTVDLQNRIECDLVESRTDISLESRGGVCTQK